MEKQDTNKIIKVLSTAYPKPYVNMTKEQQKDTLELYYEMFNGYPTEIVIYALKNYISVNEFPPTIAGLNKQIQTLMHNDDTSADLWNKVLKAIQNGIYGFKEEFDKLPPAARRWVGRPEALREFAQMDSATVNTVIRGEFLKSISHVQKAQRANDTLPDNVRMAIESFTDVKRLEE